jgi:hypothetical protein
MSSRITRAKYVIAVLSSLIICLVLGWIEIMRIRRAESEVRQLKIEIETMSSQLTIRYLPQHCNPHDLVSALTSVSYVHSAHVHAQDRSVEILLDKVYIDEIYTMIASFERQATEKVSDLPINNKPMATTDAQQKQILELFK